jgi:hypothetical protein
MAKIWSTPISIGLVLSLGGCHDVRPLDVNVISSGEIHFYVKPDQKHKAEYNCFGGIEVFSLPKENDYEHKKMVWNVYNVTEGGGCVNHVKFPDIPSGFRGEFNTKRLLSGRYQAIADIGVSYATTDFDIK